MFWSLTSSSQAAKSRSLASQRPVITAQSNWMLERALKSVVLKNARTHKIPNVISEAFFTDRLALQGMEASIESPLRIGFIAANVEDPNKGFDAAIQTLQASGLSFVFRVVGESSRKINSSNGPVHFLGPLTSSQLVYECESWDFLFVNSLQENSPTVISEMACIGVPTLSVEVGAISEMIREYGLGGTLWKNYTPLEFRDSALKLRSIATSRSKSDLSARARLLHSPRVLHEGYLRAYASED
jgi:glycosyltransferase involved in cell wall biosynthesis